VKTIVLAVVALVLVALTGFLVYLSLPFPAEADRLASASANPKYTVTETDDAIVLAPPSGSGDGLLFFPEQHVEPEAYVYKLSGLAEAGVTVVIARPILNLAIVDFRPISTFTAGTSHVDRWFVGGHGVGGTRACLHASEGRIAGLVLVAATCANDLSNSGVRVVSISGDLDQITSPGSILNSKSLLPPDTVFVKIEGANHSQFGDFGAQPGDGKSKTKDSGVRYQITEAVLELVGRN
jgi:pimeloyl-ACP methyl ester carboxylesterase